jgi:hypothetical protein
MNRKKLWLAGLLSFSLLISNFHMVFAHEGVKVGDYEIEIGWINEPPIVGQHNALVVNISNNSSGEAQPVEDVSTLTVTISYGGQSKTLTLQPLGEDTPGEFVAPLIPTVAGEYMVTLGGKLVDTDVNAEVHPEEVQPASILQFPDLSDSQSIDTGETSWLTWLALFTGLIGIGLGVTALRKPR